VVRAAPSANACPRGFGLLSELADQLVGDRPPLAVLPYVFVFAIVTPGAVAGTWLTCASHVSPARIAIAHDRVSVGETVLARRRVTLVVVSSDDERAARRGERTGEREEKALQIAFVARSRKPLRAAVEGSNPSPPLTEPNPAPHAGFRRGQRSCCRPDDAVDGPVERKLRRADRARAQWHPLRAEGEGRRAPLPRTTSQHLSTPVAGRLPVVAGRQWRQWRQCSAFFPLTKPSAARRDGDYRRRQWG
jgi:hypothetical protein